MKNRTSETLAATELNKTIHIKKKYLLLLHFFITLKVNVFNQMCTDEEPDEEVGTVNGKWDPY